MVPLNLSQSNTNASTLESGTIGGNSGPVFNYGSAAPSGAVGSFGQLLKDNTVVVVVALVVLLFAVIAFFRRRK